MTTDQVNKFKNLLRNIYSNNLAEVKSILTKTPEILEWQDYNEDTILHKVIKDENMKIHHYDYDTREKTYHADRYFMLDTLIHFASTAAVVKLDKDGYMAHQYLDSRSLVDKLVSTKGLQKGFDFDDFTFIRAIRDPFIKNPYSLYNETFADTEIRKLIRKSGSPTMTKHHAKLSGWQNRSTTLFDRMGKCFSYVGYGLDNPNFYNIICACDFDFGSGFGKKKYVRYGDAYHFKNPNTQSRHFHLVQLRNVIRQGLLDPGKNEHDMYPNNQDINEVTMDLRMDDKLKFIFYNQSSFVSGNNHNDVNYTLDTRKLMAIYLIRKFAKYTKNKNHEALPLYSFNQGRGFAEEKLPDHPELVNLLKQVILTDNPQFLTRYDSIDLFRTFAREIKQEKQLQQGVATLCNALIRSGDHNKGYEMYNIIKCMYVCGLKNSFETKNWVDNKFPKEFYHRDGRLSPYKLGKKIEQLKKDMETIESEIKNGAHSNVYPHDPAFPANETWKVLPSPRSIVKGKMTALRGDLLMLEAFAQNEKIDRPFVKDLKFWFTEQTKKNGLRFEMN